MHKVCTAGLVCREVRDRQKSEVLPHTPKAVDEDIYQAARMYNEYFVDETAGLECKFTTTVSMAEYLRGFGLGAAVTQRVTEHVGNNVRALLDVDPRSLDIPRVARAVLIKARERLRRGLSEGKTPDEVLTAHLLDKHVKGHHLFGV